MEQPGNKIELSKQSLYHFLQCFIDKHYSHNTAHAQEKRKRVAVPRAIDVYPTWKYNMLKKRRLHMHDGCCFVG